MFGHPLEILTCVVLLVLSSGCGAGEGTSKATSDSGSASDGTMTGGDGTDSAGSSSSGGVLCTPSGVLESDATRTVEAASVTTTAILLNALEHCEKEEVAIRLVLDTHAADLLGYDVAAEASLDTSDGAAVDQGFVWEGGSESSHHREGILRVAAPPLVGAEWLRLTLPGVAGVDRTFEWGADLLAHDLP